MILVVMSRRRRRHQAGFSLIEAAAGLVLIGVAMLLTMALMAQQPRIERRLAAHLEALRLMEAQLEQVRASGDLPSDGELDVSGMSPAAPDLRMWIEVDALPERSLYEVRLTARYSVFGRPFELDLESMTFTP